MNLPVEPPVEPMLATLARALPAGDYLYEPKWDGFRCLVYRSGPQVDMRSRHNRPMTRYFPELEAAFLAMPEEVFVLDGEILLLRPQGNDFAALLGRLHPAATRVDRLAAETPASFMAFDVLALGVDDLRLSPFAHRRRLLETLLGSAQPPVLLTPATGSFAEAERWLERMAAGVDGVVAKRRDMPYQPGKRAMVKVKLEQTADCVVAGFRLLADELVVSSLLLGLYDQAGALQHVGVVTSFSRAERLELAEVLGPYITSLEGHPWEHGFLVGGSPMGRLRGAAGRWTPDLELDWVPLRPELVCEVAFDQLDEDRFRHPARFRRWRPDRDPRSCTFDQLPRPGTAPLPLGPLGMSR